MDEIVQLLERFDLGPISLLCVAALIVIWRTWQAERAPPRADALVWTCARGPTQPVLAALRPFPVALPLLLRALPARCAISRSERRRIRLICRPSPEMSGRCMM